MLLAKVKQCRGLPCGNLAIVEFQTFPEYGQPLAGILELLLSMCAMPTFPTSSTSNAGKHSDCRLSRIMGNHGSVFSTIVVHVRNADMSDFQHFKLQANTAIADCPAFPNYGQPWAGIFFIKYWHPCAVPTFPTHSNSKCGQTPPLQTCSYFSDVLATMGRSFSTLSNHVSNADISDFQHFEMPASTAIVGFATL